MLTRIRKAQQSEHEQDQGFTLIELLVVVVIIGILAVIAIPTFLNQREKAWTRAVESDLRDGATLVEEHFNDAGTYADVVGPPAVNVAFKNSKDVTVPSNRTATAYCIQGVHARLNGGADQWVIRNTTGRVEKVDATATPAVAAC